MKLSHGDAVIVISGKDKGKKGTVMRVLADQNRVIVSGVNMVTKHVKKTTQSEGKKIRFEASMNASKVQIVDPKTGKPSRIGYRIEGGKKVRFAKCSGTVLTRVKKDAKEKAAEKAVAATSSKKKGFWKGGVFGSKAGAAEGSKAETGPAQTAVPTRSAGRGS
jgi:large subunit ribosomal protein L24